MCQWFPCVTGRTQQNIRSEFIVHQSIYRGVTTSFSSWRISRNFSQIEKCENTSLTCLENDKNQTNESYHAASISCTCSLLTCVSLCSSNWIAQIIRYSCSLNYTRSTVMRLIIKNCAFGRGQWKNGVRIICSTVRLICALLEAFDKTKTRSTNWLGHVCVSKPRVHACIFPLGMEVCVCAFGPSAVRISPITNCSQLSRQCEQRVRVG